MADADDYLQDGFDPRSVTIPRLRSILVTYNIDFPASAKKPQLVDLVNEYVMPQVPKVRAQRAKAKRTSMGIVNAGSAEDDPRWSDFELEAPPTLPRRFTSPRKTSSRIKKEEPEIVPIPFASTRKRTASRTASSRQSSYFDEEEAPRLERPKSARRTRSSATPQFKQESPEVELRIEPQERRKEQTPAYEEEANVFTDDNPFQSSSSPDHMKTPIQRTHILRDESVRSERPVKQRLERYTERTPVARSPASVVPRTPVSPLSKTPRPKTPNFSLDPSEEFTPEAQLELEEAAARGEVEAMVQTSHKPKRKTNLTTPFFVLFIALLGAYSAWYRQEKIAVGYCGLGRPAVRAIPSEIPIPDFLLPFVEPQCEACPLHTVCHEGLSAECHSDFVLKPHPLSFGGLVPLPSSCEPDGEKARRVQAVTQRTIEVLRARRAKFECGELVDEAGQRINSPAIAEEDLKKSVSQLRNRRMNSAEFEELWVAAIGEITTRDEIIVEMVETATTPTSNFTDPTIRYLSSSSLARLPITCAFKRSIRLGLARYRFPIGFLIALVLTAFYLRTCYRQHRATAAQVPALVDMVLERLANQKELGEEELDDPWLFLPNLRDDVLRSLHSLRERERIWQKVKVVVELNSNVRTSQREGRSGEVGRAWEWIGPVKVDGARRRRGGRPWVPESVSTPPEPKETAPPAVATPTQREIIQKKRVIF